MDFFFMSRIVKSNFYPLINIFFLKISRYLCLLCLIVYSVTSLFVIYVNKWWFFVFLTKFIKSYLLKSRAFLICFFPIYNLSLIWLKIILLNYLFFIKSIYYAFKRLFKEFLFILLLIIDYFILYIYFKSVVFFDIKSAVEK